MPMRIRQGAAMIVVVLALFLAGNTAHAGWLDWLWPFGSQVPREQTPEAGAAHEAGFIPQPSGTTSPAPTTQPPPGETPPPTTQSPPPVVNPDNPAVQPPPTTSGPQTGPAPTTQPPQGQGGPGDQFYCNSLKRIASRVECDAADRQKQEGESLKQRCEPAQVFCLSINRCASPKECADATPVCAAGQKPSDEKPCKIEETKPPFPQGDEERIRKEKEEKLRTESEQSRKQEEERMRRGEEERMKKEEMMRREQETRKEPMPFPGQGETEGQFPGKGATEGKFPGGKEGQRPEQPSFEEPREMEKPVFVDKRWVQDTLRQIRDQEKELKRLLRQAQKLTGAETLVAAMQTIATKLGEHTQRIKSTEGEDLQETVQEFHDAQYWDEINSFRMKIELPKQLKDIERALKRTKSLPKKKAFKQLANFGVNLDRVTSDLASIQATVDKVKSLIASNADAEEIQEVMQDIWESGVHPGEIEGVLRQMSDMTRELGRIKRADIKELVQELLQPIVDAINESDYREANQILGGELRFEMQKVFNQLYRFRGKVLSDTLQDKLDALQSSIEEKLEGGRGSSGAPKPVPLETAPAQ